MARFFSVFVLAVLAFAAPPAARADSPATHPGRGVVRGIEAGGRVLVIEHGAIPGYMDAMTMPFELADPSLARGLKVGDAIRFTITRKGDFWPITALTKVRASKLKKRRGVRSSKPSPGALPAAAPEAVSGAVQP